MTNQSANQTGGTGQPKILYKYLSLDRLDVLKSKTIRFTQPGDFNDPFEFRPVIVPMGADQESLDRIDQGIRAGIKGELAKLGVLGESTTPEEINTLISQFMKQVPGLFIIQETEAVKHLAPKLDEALNNNVGVLCLSEIRDSLLMWAHYSSNHRGVVLGFNADHPFFSHRRSKNDEFGFLRRVEYTPLRPRVNLKETTSAVWQTKSEQWAYEREWRIVKVLEEAKIRIETPSFPVCLFEFPPDAVEEIIVGMRFPKGRITEVQALAGTFPGVRLLAAHEHPEEYGLIIKPLV